MTNQRQILLNTAFQLTQSRISVIPIGKNKLPYASLLPIKTAPDDSPVLDSKGEPKHTWNPYRKRLATTDELEAWFGPARHIATVGGFSGHEILDFDNHQNAGVKGKIIGNVYPRWVELVKSQRPDLLAKLVINKTPRGGYHIRYLYIASYYDGNQKLAEAYEIEPHTGELVRDDQGRPKKVALIETRGEGGYAVCPPSEGYEMVQGDLGNIPTITKEERDFIIAVAQSFHAIKNDANGSFNRHSKTNPNAEPLRPGDDFNQRGDHRPLLNDAGWCLDHRCGEVEYWRRPGKDHGWSATWGHIPDRFYVFSSNASPFEDNRTYDRFSIYAILKHNGDFEAAAKDLSGQGYGSHNGHQEHHGRHGNQRQTDHKGRYTPFTVTPQPGGNGNGRNGSGGGNGPNPHQAEQKDPSGFDGFMSLHDAFYKAKEADFFDLRPPVFVNNRQMRHVIGDLQQIISDYKGEPKIYQKNGRLVRVTYAPERAQMDYFTPDTLAVTLNEYADFYKARETKEGPLFTPTPPPIYLAKGILHAPRHHVPQLDFISASPLFAPDGSVAMEPGYNPKVKAYLHLADNLISTGSGLGTDSTRRKLTDAEIDPTPENVAKSKALIEEMIAEFPFEGEASRQNAISLLLLPFLRPLIDAEIPLYVCDASDPGTGKGLLIDSLLTPYLSHRPISNTEVFGDEWRKQLTTLLEHNPDVIYFDNAQKIDSSALASALTKRYWQDRRLGKNELSTSEIRAIFVVNGNNMELSGENARRVVWIRMVPNTENPDEREFKIADLHQWVDQHRRELVVTALTLINNWVQSGMPEGDLRMGSFSR